MSKLEELREKYKLKGGKYEPNPSCKFCHGIGERPIKSRPGEMTFCICLFVDHSFSDEAGTALSDIAKRELKKLRGDE